MATLIKLSRKDGNSSFYVKPSDIVRIDDRDFSHGTITLSNGETIDTWENADEIYEIMLCVG